MRWFDHARWLKNRTLHRLHERKGFDVRNKRLEGQTALVTGAAKRIGRAISLALAEEGCNIIVHYRSSYDEAQELIEELSQTGVRAWALPGDFEKSEDYESLIPRALAITKSINILVNNASIFPPDKMESMTFKDLMINMEINAWAPFVLSRDFSDHIGEGKIINMLDSRLIDADWNHVGYILSKHVFAALTKMTALSFAPQVTVNGVAPGLILPPAGMDESYLDVMKGTVPLRRHGEAEDVAEAVVFLAKSSFITGEIIFVDGGRHLHEFKDG